MVQYMKMNADHILNDIHGAVYVLLLLILPELTAFKLAKIDCIYLLLPRLPQVSWVHWNSIVLAIWAAVMKYCQ